MSAYDDNIRVEEKVREILRWPTDTVEIDYIDPNGSPECPHTIIVFCPGNPGLVGWYIPGLLKLVQKSGRGFAARGLSYAGHGISDNIANAEQWIHRKSERDVDVPFTMDGQILHKEAYIDMVLQELKEIYGSKAAPRFIFLGHSIGCHMIQRLLIRRPDILQQTDLNIFMMPFNRMKADWLSELILLTAAAHPEPFINHAQGLMKLLNRLPPHILDAPLKRDIRCENGRRIAVDLLQQAHFGRNFFELGMEEVRDVPEVPDVSAYRVIGNQCPICILYVGHDKWAPTFHNDDLAELKSKGSIPKNIHTTYMPHLVHDYVVRPEMVPSVDDFCFDAIRKHVLEAGNPRSRL